MRIGLFGGSFDPFHNGHRLLVETALARAKVDRVVVVPVGTPPHKMRRLSLAAFRYELVRLGLTGLSDVILWDDDIRSPGVDYTVDTVARVFERFSTSKKRAKCKLILGQDSFLSLPTWRLADQFLPSVRLFVVRRSDTVCDLEAHAAALRARYGTKTSIVDANQYADVSSTVVRQRLADGLSLFGFVPEPVDRALQRLRPYAFTDDLNTLSDSAWRTLSRYEAMQWPLLPQARRIHVANVMAYAVHLARRHGVDVMNAATAGLLHDVAKALPLSEQVKYAARLGHRLARGHEAVVHGPAGAYMAHKRFGVVDRETLAAMFYHVTSRALMTPLDQIVYLADKIELGRPYRDLVPIREAAERDLDLAMRLCLDAVAQALTRSHKTIHPDTEAARKMLRHMTSPCSPLTKTASQHET